MGLRKYMAKLQKQSRSVGKIDPVFPVIGNDGLPLLRKLTMDEYLAFISVNISLFPEIYRNDNLVKWKKEIVPARFVLR